MSEKDLYENYFIIINKINLFIKDKKKSHVIPIRIKIYSDKFYKNNFALFSSSKKHVVKF